MKYTVLAALFVAGCGVLPTTTSRTGAAPASGPDTCNAAAHQGLVGMDAALSLALPEPKRLVGPNDAVTTEFNAGRLNVQLNETDNIIAITCG